MWNEWQIGLTFCGIWWGILFSIAYFFLDMNIGFIIGFSGVGLLIAPIFFGAKTNFDDD